jgi:hypothetical protein
LRRLLHRWRRQRRRRQGYPLIYRPVMEGREDDYRPSISLPPDPSLPASGDEEELPDPRPKKS